MNWQMVRILLAHELRMLLKDRRTVVLAVLLPVLVLPLFFFATKALEQAKGRGLEDHFYAYSVTGTRADALRKFIRAAKIELAELPGGGKADAVRFQFEENAVRDAPSALLNGEIHFYLEALTGEEADALSREEEKSADQSGKSRGERESSADRQRRTGVPLVRIHYRADDFVSRHAMQQVRDLLLNARQARRGKLLQDRGFAASSDEVLAVEKTDLASAAQSGGSRLGQFLAVVLVMFMLSGGSVASMDIIAGEKERGSLETLLTTAVRRSEIVAAKQLTILVVSLFITLVQIANILVYLTFEVMELPEGLALEATPGAVATLLLLFMPVAALVAAVLLLISAYARSYKEAQLYFFPVYVLTALPALAPVLPGLSLRSAIAVVPIANVSLAAREVLTGTYDWPMILLAVVSTMLAAAWLASVSARLLTRENLVTSGDTEAADIKGGSALFPRHVLRWYAVLGAALFITALNLTAGWSLPANLLFSQLVFFLGGSLAMILAYRLNPREALALRPVKPMVWPAVFIAIPCGAVASTGVFKLANFVVPVPEQVLERFARDLLPADLSLWELLFFLAVLPGIFEEIAFRGTLLYGMRKKLRPVALTLTVGIIFGLFHVSLFRILPTAFMGILLTAIALLTGSIFPCMLLHAGNNAFGVWAATQELQLKNLHGSTYVLAALGLVFSFWLMYRHRTPYPGLITSSPKDKR